MLIGLWGTPTRFGESNLFGCFGSSFKAWLVFFFGHVIVYGLAKKEEEKEEE